MKTKLLSILFIALFFNAKAQETTVDLSMESNYTDMIYYKLDTETTTNFAADSWDIAFLRVSSFDIDIRSNDHNGIEVFEASANIADWSTIDIANEENWTNLYNNTTEWVGGAYSQGSAGYGWGEYNSIDHHVYGTVIFVLKYANGDYVKFINEDFYGGYTFKYAKWNATNSVWEADQTITIPNSSNEDNRYNYFSFQNDSEVIAEPAITDWDFVFTKYVIDYFGDGTVYYPVTGVLNNSTVQVSENIEADGDPLPSGLTYSEDISTIGSDWKSYNGTGYDVNSDQRYYVKYENGTIYRMYFTEFEGGSTGNLSFQFENVTSALGIEDVTENVSFGLYPNPTKDKKVSLIYDINTLNTKNEIMIYTINGVKVYNTNLNGNSGFYNKTLDLSSLESGIYMLQFKSGNASVTKKLILN